MVNTVKKNAAPSNPIKIANPILPVAIVKTDAINPNIIVNIAPINAHFPTLHTHLFSFLEAPIIVNINSASAANINAIIIAVAIPVNIALKNSIPTTTPIKILTVAEIKQLQDFKHILPTSFHR